MDDAAKGKEFFLKAVDLLASRNAEVRDGLEGCEEELDPDASLEDVRRRYREMLINKAVERS